MEKAIFVNGISDLKNIKHNYDRFYIGNEFCEKLIPKSSEIKIVQDTIFKMNKNLTIVLSYSTNKYLQNIVEVLKKLDLDKDGLEIVVNDLGTLYFLNKNYPNIKLVAGRLLNKTKRDPRIFKVKDNMNANIYDFYKCSNLNTRESMEFLKKMNVDRIEFDFPLHGVKLINDKFKYSIIHPYTYVTTGRFCIYNQNTWKPQREYKCEMNCKNSIIEITNDNFPCKVFRKGNSIFYKNSIEDIGMFEKMGFDRIIYYSIF